MKNLNLFAGLLLLLLFSSCVKNSVEDDVLNDKKDIETSMTAEINGVSFESDDVNGRIQTPASSSSKALTIAADGMNKNTMYFSVYDYDGVGSYTHENNNPNYTNLFQYTALDSVLVNDSWQTYNDVWSTNSGLGNYGNITITKETSTYVDGTFDFRSKGNQGDTIIVTNGVFHAQLR